MNGLTYIFGAALLLVSSGQRAVIIPANPRHRNIIPLPVRSGLSSRVIVPVAVAPRVGLNKDYFSSIFLKLSRKAVGNEFYRNSILPIIDIRFLQ
jgi:hypothetical protein